MRGRTLPAGTDLIVERLTPAAFPMYILNLTGSVPAADLYDYAFYVMRPRLARVAGAGQVEVTASDTREIEVVVDPARLLTAGLTVHDVVGTAAGREPARAGGAVLVRRRAAARARLGSVAVNRRDRADAGLRPPRRRAARAGRRPRCSRARPIAPGSSPATAATRRASASRSRSAPTSSRSRPASSRRSSELARALPAGLQITKVYDLAEFVRGVDRQRPRCDPDRRLSRGRHPAACSCATGG